MATGNSGINTPPEVSSIDLKSELAGCRQHKPWQSGLFTKLLFKAGDLRVVLIAMEAGARMKEHRADGTVSIHALQGALGVHVQGQTCDLHAEQILVLGPGVRHDVEAREDSAFLLTIAWPDKK
jgi:quercetin dioxygenase-like cupin family protein